MAAGIPLSIGRDRGRTTGPRSECSFVTCCDQADRHRRRGTGPCRIVRTCLSPSMPDVAVPSGVGQRPEPDQTIGDMNRCGGPIPTPGHARQPRAGGDTNSPANPRIPRHGVTDSGRIRTTPEQTVLAPGLSLRHGFRAHTERRMYSTGPGMDGDAVAAHRRNVATGRPAAERSPPRVMAASWTGEVARTACRGWAVWRPTKGTNGPRSRSACPCHPFVERSNLIT